MPALIRTGLTIVLCGGLLLACRRPAPSVASRDPRTPLPLGPEAQDAVLTEMRTMLGSLNGVLTALAQADPEAMRRAAAASGLATAADPALEKALPLSRQ